MKKIFLGSGLLILALGLSERMALAAAGVEPLPKPFNFARYQTMTDRSPFAVASKPPAPVEAPNFAKDLYIANAARSPDGDHVTVASSTDKMFKKYLTTHSVVDGYSIVGIEWSEKVGATKVTISKEGQTATLGFNEALLRQPGAPGQNPAGAAPPTAMQQPAASKGGGEPQADTKSQAPGSAATMPNMPQAQPPQQAKPMPVPMVPTPQPRVRGVIPRNPGGS